MIVSPWTGRVGSCTLLFFYYKFSSRKIETGCFLKLHGPDEGKQQVASAMTCNLILIRHYLQDVFKVSGKQVSPTEIENTIREHPSRFITDVAVAGVQGERMSDELVPRAWVVLSDAGKERGEEAVLAAIDKWARLRLSKHKWLRGGFQVVEEVSHGYWYLKG